MQSLKKNTYTRQEWLGILARSDDNQLREFWSALNLEPNFTWMRTPEIGSVMVQGRMGGTGNPFNVGEVTVTRSAIKLGTGEVGHAYAQGRCKRKSQIIALIDALMQTDKNTLLIKNILIPLSEQNDKRNKNIQSEAEKTKVDFFTLVRGDDE